MCCDYLRNNIVPMKHLLLICFFTICCSPLLKAQEVTTIINGEKPPVPGIQLKNTSDSANHCNKVKIIFTASMADTLFICVRENKDGVPGPWFRNRSNIKAKDGDYKGLNESINYDFRIEARNPYGITFSEVLTREKCK